MDTVLWTPRFAVVYFVAAALLLVLFLAVDASLVVASPLLLILVALGIAVLMRNRQHRPIR
ncbi:hypothetical protein HQO83_15200 [Rhodococcus fascians]|nr:hypothetical protein [Rhodococcus fascians]